MYVEHCQALLKVTLIVFITARITKLPANRHVLLTTFNCPVAMTFLISISSSSVAEASLLSWVMSVEGGRAVVE